MLAVIHNCSFHSLIATFCRWFCVSLQY